MDMDMDSLKRAKKILGNAPAIALKHGSARNVNGFDDVVDQLDSIVNFLNGYMKRATDTRTELDNLMHDIKCAGRIFQLMQDTQ